MLISLPPIADLLCLDVEIRGDATPVVDANGAWVGRDRPLRLTATRAVDVEERV